MKNYLKPELSVKLFDVVDVMEGSGALPAENPALANESGASWIEGWNK